MELATQGEAGNTIPIPTSIPMAFLILARHGNLLHGRHAHSHQVKVF
ncbi:MAG: hypothetical protein WC708_07575 [Lentisphaeria bacterium]